MYQKEIIYMGLYKDGSRIGNAGFLKVENKEEGSRFHLKLQNIPYDIKGRFPIRVHNGNDWKEINGISIQEGGGSWEENRMETTVGVQIQVTLPGGYFLEGRSKAVSESDRLKKGYERGEREGGERIEKAGSGIGYEQQDALDGRAGKILGSRQEERPVSVADKELEREQMSGPEIESKEDSTRATVEMQTDRLLYRPEELQDGEKTALVHTAQRNEDGAEESTVGSTFGNRKDATRERQKTIIITEELQRPSLEGNLENTADVQTAMPRASYNLKEDKWEQILDSYERIHPYGDERIYVKLEPKDFIILQAKYQHLVNNSFLLHGFYNYRYIILGKEQDYYLGVPGVFYEREKMVALMFGFEAFECPGGTARAGEFGYYLRKVEL